MGKLYMRDVSKRETESVTERETERETEQQNVNLK